MDWEMFMWACVMPLAGLPLGFILGRRERKRQRLWLTTEEVVIIAGASVPCESVGNQPGRAFENRQHFLWMAKRLVEISKKYDRDAK